LEYYEFIRCAEKFFIEIISCFCFEQMYDTKDPTPDLVNYLMDRVKTDCAQHLTPSLDEELDKTPILRSSLLKLLISIK